MEIDRKACTGLSEADLSLLKDGKLAHDSQKIGVWVQDDISPASYMLNYKVANAVLWWTPFATTRLTDLEGQEAQVVLHQDGTLLEIRSKGQFISQYTKNSSDDSARLRSFTHETIPFK